MSNVASATGDRLFTGITKFNAGNPLLSGAGLSSSSAYHTTRMVARSTRHSKRKIGTKTRRKKGRRYKPHTAGKRRDRSTRRIRYTKKGQPYVIMRSGKARFIKMSSASRSHKRKGGKY